MLASLVLTPLVMAAAAHVPVNDIRIIIDVSGSMKQNDPHNLRVPALRMMTGLLPKGSRAGVWTFAQYVNNLVPVREVTPAWKDATMRTVGEIHSRGLYTNIEGVLKDAMWDWTAPDPKTQRTLIFLTDGLVDISPDAALNHASRRRVIEELIPQMVQNGVTVHTIAMAEGVDHALLQQLSFATHGWHEQAKTADDLERIFLRMFEKTTQPEKLPLKENKIKVDASIEEMTLLIFRKNGSAPATVVDANQQILTSKKKNPNVKWYSDARYDLITIAKPAPGQWEVKAAMDPDNRVMVVSNLKMDVAALPDHVAVDDPLYLLAQLTQQGERISDQDFLKLLNIEYAGTKNQQTVWRAMASDDGTNADQTAHDGLYSTKIDQALDEGMYEIVAQTNSPTFQRENRQSFQVHDSPVYVNVSKATQAQHAYQISLVPYAGMVVPERLEAEVSVTHQDEETERISLQRTGLAEWTAVLEDIDPAQTYNAEIVVRGERESGKKFEIHFGPIALGATENIGTIAPTPPAAMEDEEEDTALTEEEQGMEMPAVEDHEPAPEPATAQPVAQEPGVVTPEPILPTAVPTPLFLDLNSTMLRVVLVNLIIIGLAIPVYYILRKILLANPADKLKIAT